MRNTLLKRARAEGGFTQRELEEPPPEEARAQYKTLVDNRLSWTLTNLKREGLVENPRWSTWRLTSAASRARTAAAPVSPDRLAELRAMPQHQYLLTAE